MNSSTIAGLLAERATDLSKMKSHNLGRRSKWVWLSGCALLVTLAALTLKSWYPGVSYRVKQFVGGFRSGDSSTIEEKDAHLGHSHVSHTGNRDDSSLKLSEQARRNIGLTSEAVRPVVLENVPSFNYRTSRNR